MSEIKLIDKKTDLSNLVKLNWDAYNDDKPLTVYKLENYIHSIGGHYGDNNYWCCYRNETPTYKTLMEFAGNPCNWGIEIKENNYHKFKYNEHEILCNVKICITRNKNVFYSFNANNFDYGLVKARKLLFEINEHPIYFNEIDYQNQIIGRKIYFEKMPCIIESYTIGSDSIIIKPDLNYMSIFVWQQNLSDYFEGAEMIPEDLFASSINWFRD